MTDEKILEIRDSLLPSQGEPFDTLAFGRAVAAAQRETCAQVCEAEAAKWEADGQPEPMARICAAAIRVWP